MVPAANKGHPAPRKNWRYILSSTDLLIQFTSLILNAHLEVVTAVLTSLHFALPVDLFLQRVVDEGFSVSLKTYLLASEQGNFSKGAVGTALGEWNHVGIIVDMATSPFDYRKKNVNNDFETEDALRNQCTKYVIYGTVDGVMAERLDILLDRNMMKYNLCALKPLEDSSSIGGIKDGTDGEPSSPSPSPSSPSSPISQKYNSRSSKSSKSTKKGKLRIDTGDDDDDDDDDADEVDLSAEDFHRSAMLRAIQLHDEVEDKVDSLLRMR